MMAGKAESGKGTVGDIFKEYFSADGKRVCVVAFADVLKFYLSQYLQWDGNKDDFGRHMLQNVGENVRSKNKSYWAHRVVDFINLFKEDYFDVFIIPDTRYPNEINAILANFPKDEIYTLWVNREDHISKLTDQQKNHSSENSLNYDDCDYVINNRSMEQLHRDIKYFYDNITKNDEG